MRHRAWRDCDLSDKDMLLNFQRNCMKRNEDGSNHRSCYFAAKLAALETLDAKATENFEKLRICAKACFCFVMVSLAQHVNEPNNQWPPLAPTVRPKMNSMT